ncbi:MAG: hypothetical protein ACX932_06830 [Gammaproteobacteria bacterium]
MNSWHPLETQYLHARELYDELCEVLSIDWDEEHRVGRGRSTKNVTFSEDAFSLLKKKVDSELETLHYVYKNYYTAKRDASFLQVLLSYIPFYKVELKQERWAFKKALRLFRHQQKINYKTLCQKTGIHLGAKTALLAFLHNDYNHMAYYQQRSRNGSKNHVKYNDYYRSHVYLHDIYHRFYLSKSNYVYLGLFFFGGLLFTALSFAAMVGWPPAVWIMLGSNVGIIALKLTLVLGSIPIFYLTNGFFELKNRAESKKTGEEEYAKADWHLSNALTLDIIVAVATLLAIALPLFYIMTVPHGIMVSLWIMATLTTLSACQAALVYLDGKRRVGYLGSGLLGSVGQKQEALNQKLPLKVIFSLSIEHRRHLIKYLLNPFAWLTSFIEVTQQLALRCCEIGTIAGSRSSLFRFKLKQDIDLFIDFMVSPIRLVAVLWDMCLSAFDFIPAKYIPLQEDHVYIPHGAKHSSSAGAVLTAVLNGSQQKTASVSEHSCNSQLINKLYFRWQPVGNRPSAPKNPAPLVGQNTRIMGKQVSPLEKTVIFVGS